MFKGLINIENIDFRVYKSLSKTIKIGLIIFKTNSRDLSLLYRNTVSYIISENKCLLVKTIVNKNISKVLYPTVRLSIL